MTSVQPILDFYKSKCDLFGRSAKACGWYSDYSQQLRFLILTLCTDWTGKRILDVGCGQGHLLEYVLEQDIDIASYLGMDLCPDMLEKCPGSTTTAAFVQGDFMTYPFVVRYDVVVASGLLSHKVEDQMRFVEDRIRMLFDLCEEVAALNFLSCFTAKIEQDTSTFFYYDPVAILTLCLKLTPYVELKQSYLPNDFTVYLFKR